jgi:hypothetical protein
MRGEKKKLYEGNGGEGGGGGSEGGDWRGNNVTNSGRPSMPISIQFPRLAKQKVGGGGRRGRGEGGTLYAGQRNV